MKTNEFPGFFLAISMLVIFPGVLFGPVASVAAALVFIFFALMDIADAIRNKK